MIQQRNVDAVKVLIDCGVDLTTTKSGFPPLVLAAILGSDEIVRLLLEAGVNPNENKNFIALIYAAWTGNAKMVKHLLEHGADRYAVHNGQTYLHLAIDCASAGSFYDETIALLINGNEHLDAPITLEGFVNGVTALYLAAFTNNISALRLLLQAGAQPNRARTDGMTPLFIAAQRGNAEAVELLLQNSAFTELAWNGLTPLCIAVLSGHIGIVKSLLAHGARKDVCDNSGKTVLEMAQETKNPEILALLAGEPLLTESSISSEAARAAESPSQN